MNENDFPQKHTVILEIWVVMLLLLFLASCSIFSRNPGKALPTVTLTVTETATVTVTPESSEFLLDEEITPPGEIINVPGQNYSTKAVPSDLEDYPGRDKIIPLLKKGYITVFEDGNFKPQEPIKRGVYVLWLYNASGRKAPLANPDEPHFPDLPPDHWLYPVVEGICQAGGFEGYPDKTFKPDSNLTRQQWCVINSFFAADPRHIIEAVDTFPDHFKLNNYNDFKKVNKSYAKFVEYACSAMWCEKVFGKPVHKIPFKPDKPVTREQAAHWIFHFEKSLKIY